MPSDKFVLLEQIKSAIKKKWSNPDFNIFDYPLKPDSLNKITRLNNKNLIQQEKDAALLKNLEQRLEALECQNDHLFSFINSLIENLPDLVINIVRSEWEAKNLSVNTVGERVPDNSFQKTKYTLNNDQPCPTRREKDILELLVNGFCAKEIANRLFISETTVITHKKNLKEKFNAKNTVELVSKAYIILSRVAK